MHYQKWKLNDSDYCWCVDQMETSAPVQSPVSALKLFPVVSFPLSQQIKEQFLKPLAPPFFSTLPNQS